MHIMPGKDDVMLIPQTAAEVAAYLPDEHHWRIEAHDCLDSTNTVLKCRAAQGEAAGLVLLADRQTAGRGRMTRSFFSPPGCGLYMSLLVRPALTAGNALLLTTAAAVATADAIAAVTGRVTGIKWVNDLFWGDRKVCGILTESSLGADGRLVWAVVGIGINVRAPREGFPPELAEIAGALLPADAPDLRPRLAAEILARCSSLFACLPEPTHLEEYRRRSILIGRSVTLSTTDERVTVEGIDDACRLLVRDAAGGVRAISTGECSVRLQNEKHTNIHSHDATREIGCDIS